MKKVWMMIWRAKIQISELNYELCHMIAYDSLWLISLRQGTYMLICSWLKTNDDDGGNDDEDDGGNDDDGDGGGGGDKECDREHEE